jgi:SAM-dependent methyltransferase
MDPLAATSPAANPSGKDTVMTVVDTRSQWNQVGAEFVDRHCDLCGSDASHALVRLHGSAYHRCEDCGLIYARPIARNLTAINEHNYAGNLESYAAKVERQKPRNLRRLRRFARYRQTGNFLELGCNAGIVIAAARDAGWRAHGVDIAVAATTYARETLGLEVYCGTLAEAAYADDYFDVVYSNSVLEHLEHPFANLLEARRILRPGGVFYADTVNWDSYTRRILGTGWRYIDPIDHVHLYTPRNVRELARRAGFEVERIWTTGVRVEPNQPGTRWRPPWYLRLCKGPLSLAVRFTGKGDAIRFLLRKPLR